MIKLNENFRRHEAPDTAPFSPPFKPDDSRSDFVNGTAPDIVHDYMPSDIEKFIENPNQIEDDYEYPRKGKDPGLVVIFNQESFDTNLDLRKGSRRDVNELIQTFGRVGFNMEKRRIYNDLTREEILEELRTLSEMDYSEINCLIVVVLTHGDSGEVLHVKDGLITTADVWKKFVDCPSLKHKPKMFIFQACKGQHYSASHQITNNGEATDHLEEPGGDKIAKVATEDDVKLVPKDTFRIPFGPDMLLVYAAVEGNVSYRHRIRGSWFIQEMCRNINGYGRRDDVISLITRTIKGVANNYFYEEEDGTEVRKQMPLLISTLARKFYFTKSKDRNYLLRFINEHKSMRKTVKELEAKVDVLYKNYEKEHKIAEK